jgi:hypothetical protein
MTPDANGSTRVPCLYRFGASMFVVNRQPTPSTFSGVHGKTRVARPPCGRVAQRQDAAPSANYHQKTVTCSGPSHTATRLRTEIVRDIGWRPNFNTALPVFNPVGGEAGMLPASTSRGCGGVGKGKPHGFRYDPPGDGSLRRRRSAGSMSYQPMSSVPSN